MTEHTATHCLQVVERDAETLSSCTNGALMQCQVLELIERERIVLQCRGPADVMRLDIVAVSLRAFARLSLGVIKRRNQRLVESRRVKERKEYAAREIFRVLLRAA